MIYCQNCGAVIPEDTKFCGKCGTAAPAKGVLCNSCGESVAEGAGFCGKCGAAAQAYQMPVNMITKPPAPKKPLTSRPAFWIISSVAFLFILVVIIAAIFDDDDETSAGTDIGGGDPNTQTGFNGGTGGSTDDYSFTESGFVIIPLDGGEFVGFLENGTADGFGILRINGSYTYVGMFRDDEHNGFGIRITPDDGRGSSALVAGNYVNGMITGQMISLGHNYHGQYGICTVALIEDSQLVDHIGDFTGEYEFAVFETDNPGIVYTGMVLVGTLIPDGFGYLWDTVNHDFHVGLFEYGVPSGYGIQARASQGEWFDGIWEGGVLTEVFDYVGYYGATAISTWPVNMLVMNDAYDDGLHGESSTYDGSYGEGVQIDYYDAQNYGLSVVRIPPPYDIPCNLCKGTLQYRCTTCHGSGSVSLGSSNEELHASFGNFTNNFFNNFPCNLCAGTGDVICGFGSCEGTEPNPELYEYVRGLKALADQTGMRIFQLEDNQVSTFLALDFCTFGCDGTGLTQALLMFDGVPACGFCLAEGHKLYYIDSFSDEELRRPVDQRYREGARFHGGHTSEFERNYDTGRGGCISSGCSNPRPASGNPQCTSCQAGRSTVDLGGSSSGNCIQCGAKTYSSASTCGACR